MIIYVCCLVVLLRVGARDLDAHTSHMIQLTRELHIVTRELIFRVFIHPLTTTLRSFQRKIHKTFHRILRGRHFLRVIQRSDDLPELIEHRARLCGLCGLGVPCVGFIPGVEREAPHAGGVSEGLGVEVVVDAVSGEDDEVSLVAASVAEPEVAEVRLPSLEVGADAAAGVGWVVSVEAVVLCDVSDNAGAGRVMEYLAVSDADAHPRVLFLEACRCDVENSAASHSGGGGFDAVAALSDLLCSVLDTEDKGLAKLCEVCAAPEVHLNEAPKRDGCCLSGLPGPSTPVAPVSNHSHNVLTCALNVKLITDRVSHVRQLVVVR